MRINNERFYYETDHLGNTRIVFSPRDQYFKYIHFASDFYPYGLALRQYISVPEKYQFTGKQRDEETELDYFGARFFDSDIARFEAIDPLAHKFPAWSTYSFCFDNPLKFVDPDGRAPLTDFINKNTGTVLHMEDGQDQISIVSDEDFGKLSKLNMPSKETWSKEESENYLNIRSSSEKVDLNSDLGLLARIGYAEFRGSYDAEQQAGMAIVLNRVESDKFPNTVEGVIRQKSQFSSLLSSDPNKKYFDDPQKQANNLRSNYSSWLKSISNAYKVMYGDKRDIAKDAVLYYSPRSMMPSGSMPSWNFNLLEEVEIDGVRTSHIRAFRYK